MTTPVGQPAVDLAVRRLGARDRATLTRCDDLSEKWGRSARFKPTDDVSRAVAQTLRDCARELTDALAGPTTNTQETTR